MPTALGKINTGIVDRLLVPWGKELTAPAAKSILEIQFTDAEQDRIEELVTQSKKAKLTKDQRKELEEYLRWSYLLDKLHAKARITLKRRSVS